MSRVYGWGCRSVGGASGWHADDDGSDPRCGREVFSQSPFTVQTLLRCPYTPRVQSHAFHICAHVKDPVVHVRVWWIMETLKHSACTVGWVARLCRSWLSPGGGGECDPNFPMGEIPLGQYSCLGVTCPLHFWQNASGLLRATAVTRGVERTPNKKICRQS